MVLVGDTAVNVVCTLPTAKRVILLANSVDTMFGILVKKKGCYRVDNDSSPYCWLVIEACA